MEVVVSPVRVRGILCGVVTRPPHTHTRAHMLLVCTISLLELARPTTLPNDTFFRSGAQPPHPVLPRFPSDRLGRPSHRALDARAQARARTQPECVFAVAPPQIVTLNKFSKSLIRVEMVSRSCLGLGLRSGLEWVLGLGLDRTSH